MHLQQQDTKWLFLFQIVFAFCFVALGLGAPSEDEKTNYPPPLQVVGEEETGDPLDTPEEADTEVYDNSTTFRSKFIFIFATPGAFHDVMCIFETSLG